MDERYPINAIHQAPNGFISSGSIPTELRDRPQWVAWKYSRLRGNGKQGKVPINPKSLKRADPTKPETWGTYEQALAAASSGGGLEGIGYVFSKDDPNLGTDIDGCRNPNTGDVHPAALEITEQLGGYWEVSPSGTGLHGIVQATKPGKCCSTTDTPWGGKIELYDRDRFFTVTGEVFSNGKIEERQEAITGLYGGFFPEPGEDTAQAPARDVQGHGYPGTDSELVAKACGDSKTGPMFSTLYYEGDASGFGWDQSRADHAFFGTLAFWTGGDAERMERIGRDSAMYRGKWITHRTYIRQHTIPNAIKSCRSFYDPDFNGRAGVRRTVEVLRSGAGSVRRDNDRAIYLTLLEVAERVGQVRGSWIVFNANQEEIAGTTGIKQRTVSHRLTRMMEKGVIERTSKGVQGRNSFYRIPYLANTDVGGASATDYQGWHLANPDKHMGGESCVVEKKPRPRGAEEEKEKEDEPTPQTKTLTGPEIEAEWKAGEHHPLGCECITCSLQTPRYAKPHGEPGVGKLRKAA